jgi:hypothetical protein
MNPIPIHLESAPGAKLILNSLCASTDPAYLDQDMVLVELPGAIFIDVSWSPEHDRSGAYFVTVFRRDAWESPLDVAEATDPLLAARLVEEFAQQHSLLSRPDSSSQEHA